MLCDESFQSFHMLACLLWLNVDLCAISDVGVYHISRAKSLCYLSLHACFEVSNACVPYLATMNDLQHVLVHGTNITEVVAAAHLHAGVNVDFDTRPYLGDE